MADSARSKQTNAARTEFFQQIKPCCVSISKSASKSSQTALDSGHLTNLVQELLELISAQVQRDSTVFDKNIADYIFFPLAYIFKNQEQHPLTLVELTLRCLTILIFHGWKVNIEPELVQQLLLFLTFVIGGVPTQAEKREVSEEAVLESLTALDTLVSVAGKSAVASAALVDAAGIPALGHAITVLLECLSEGKTPEIQLEAMKTLRTLFTTIKDNAALASFLPGTVSSLAKVLSTPAREKRKVLIGAIQTLQKILTRVLGDLQTRVLLRELELEEKNKVLQAQSSSMALISMDANPDSASQETVNVVNQEEKNKVWSASWLRATVGQVRIALATVLKLSKSDEDEVRLALERLCITLLDECHRSLDNCTPLLVEAAMALSDEKSDDDFTSTGLSDLAMVYPELADTIKSAVYSWVTSLPRVMQSADEAVKQRAIGNLKRGLHFASIMNFASSTLDDAVSGALRDSITQLMLNSWTPKVVDEVETMELLSGSKELRSADTRLTQFRPILMAHESQNHLRSEVVSLVSSLGTATQQAKLASEMMEYMQGSVGEAQVSAFWLSFELLQAALNQTSEFDAFIAFESSKEAEAAFNDLYAYSVSVLDSHSDFIELDWRLEALAIEAVAFAASRSKETFRPELIDVLFPVTSFLGSDNVQLRHHAIVGLNSIAMACEYNSVSQLIIENADYMVNSVSLRLNTLNVTPATNKVLQMVVRLAGPKLVPYLEDVVNSIFSALNNYHGYPVFVEGLFSVLNEVVIQGVKSDQLLLEGRPTDDMPIQTNKSRKKWTTLEQVRESLIRREEKRKQRQREDEEFERDKKPYPERPWKSDLHKTKSRITKVFDDEEEKRGDHDAEEPQQKLGEEDEEAQQPPEPENIPPTPTYSILSRIAELTQHYLTSPTPTLRRSLLSLLATVSPALAHDSTAFLPLVNTVWPVIIQRLYDSEPFIAIAACETLAAICASAGDFMTTRFKDEWNSRMFTWVKKVKQEAMGDGMGQRRIGGGSVSDVDILVPSVDGKRVVKKGGPNKSSMGIIVSDMSSSNSSSLGRFAQSSKIWEATIQLIVAILRHVGVEDEMYDQMLELLSDQLHREEVRTAFETINPDAVWLALLQRGEIATQTLVPPEVEGVVFAPLIA